MANPVVLQDNFAAGMKRDFPQDQMPDGSAWEIQDMLPNRVGTGTDQGEYRTIETRGGWNYRTNALTGETDVRAVGLFVGASAVEAWICSDGSIYTSTLTSATATNRGTIGSAPVQNPVEFYDADDEWLVCFPDTPNPYRLRKTLGTLTNMVSADSAPAAYYGDVWKQRMWLGNTAANPTRVYFSAGGDVGDWTGIAEDWVDTDETVDGLASLRTVLLVFHPTKTTRFRGSPPDLIVEEAFNLSPFDMFSWTRTATETIVMATPEGIFLTDGSATKDLTKAGGMGTWWRERMQEAKDNSVAPTCPIGHANGWIVFNLQYSSFQHAFAVNVEAGSFFRLTNHDFQVFASVPGVAAAGLAGDEIWAGTSGADPRGCSVYPDIFTTAQQDGDGTEPTPLIETRFFTGKGPIQAPARAMYFTYNLGGATAVTGTYKTNPRMQHSEYSLPMNLAVSSAADELKRRRVRIAQRDALANGVAVRLTKTASAGNFALHSVEAEIKAREGSRIHYYGG